MSARNLSIPFIASSLVRGIIVRVALPLGAALMAPAVMAQAGAECVPGGTVAQTNACAVKDYQEADTALNIYYGDVMRILSAHERPGLRQDQSNWQRSSRQYCKRHNRGKEGQADWERLYHECLIAVIKSRRTALTQWLHTGEAPASTEPTH